MEAEGCKTTNCLFAIGGEEAFLYGVEIIYRIGLTVVFHML
jgi:hypothetical protein